MGIHPKPIPKNPIFLVETLKKRLRKIRVFIPKPKFFWVFWVLGFEFYPNFMGFWVWVLGVYPKLIIFRGYNIYLLNRIK